MDLRKRLKLVFKSAQKIAIDDSSKIIIISDIHRGDGSRADDFSKNEDIFIHALKHYYKEGYTYIELGDGDELWENDRMSDIVRAHLKTFLILRRFIKENRIYFLYGNHDIAKRKRGFPGSGTFQSEPERECFRLLSKIKYHEGIILQHLRGYKIYLIHGHQADYFNDELAGLSRFLVRNLWKPLELFGISDPTSASCNKTKKLKITQKLIWWAKKENKMIVAGHTHSEMFSMPGKSPYFNVGCCLHTGFITGIEIVEGMIMLVRWLKKEKNGGAQHIVKEVLAGPCALSDYFQTKMFSGTRR